MKSQKILDATEEIMGVAFLMLQTAHFLEVSIGTAKARAQSEEVILQSSRITCLCEEILNEIGGTSQ